MSDSQAAAPVKQADTVIRVSNLTKLYKEGIISLETAIRGYTVNAAYAEFAEKSKGTIAKGMLADVVVLSQDLFQIDAMKIFETKVVMTVFDGRIVFEAGR